jgi:cytochrome c553
MPKTTIDNGWTRIPITPLPVWLIAALVVALVAVDFTTGPFFQFPSAYILLIVAVSWCNGTAAGVTLALVLPSTRVLLMEFYWMQPWDRLDYFSTAGTRMLVWTMLAVMAGRLAHHERETRKKVDVLISMLPVCADCHKIHATDGGWQRLDAYAAAHKEQFSPGLCPTCQRSRLPEHVAPE